MERLKVERLKVERLKVERLKVERLKGIEPSSSDWKSEALPLSYSRVTLVDNSSSGPLTCRFAWISSR